MIPAFCRITELTKTPLAGSPGAATTTIGVTSPPTGRFPEALAARMSLTALAQNLQVGKETDSRASAFNVAYEAEYRARK